jgi:hypothetical protein
MTENYIPTCEFCERTKDVNTWVVGIGVVHELCTECAYKSGASRRTPISDSKGEV